jgi:ferredoxin/nitrate reductase gamma subunit
MLFGFIPIDVWSEPPMRVVGANIPYEWLIYVIAVIPVAVLLYGLYQKVRVYMAARGKVNRLDNLGARILSWFTYTFAQAKVIKSPLAGWMHFFLFWGFLLLFMAAGIDAMHHFINWPHLEGNFYIVFSFVVDTIGFLGMVGILVLGIIRYVQKPDRLNDTKSSDGWIIVALFSILFTGFLIEGLRIAAQIKMATQIQYIAYEKAASPFGWLFAQMFVGANMDSILVWHRILWWFHMALAFGTVVLIPFTKLWHIATSMANYFFRDLGPKGAYIKAIENIEEAESFGVENLEDFTWKDFLDFDACIRCGRCQDNCPAYLTGKHLNPKITLIQALKKHMDEKVPYLLAAGSHSAAEAEMAMTEDEEAKPVMEQSLCKLAIKFLLGLFGKIDGNIAAQNQVKITREPVSQKIVFFKFHHLFNAFYYLKIRITVKILVYQVSRNSLYRLLAINAVLCLVQYRLIQIGCPYAVDVTGKILLHHNGQRIRLFTGGTAGTPDF